MLPSLSVPLVVSLLGVLLSLCNAGLPPVSVVSSDPANDVSKTVCGKVVACSSFTSPHTAFGAAAPGSGVLVFADGYPLNATVISASDWAVAVHKHLRVFVELPGSLPAGASASGSGSVSLAPPSVADYYHRPVVSNNASSTLPLPLPNLAIGMAQGSYFVAISCPDCLAESVMVYDQVAGNEMAAFGLTPPSGQNPLLWAPTASWAPPGLLVAATSFSILIRARFAPQYFWVGVWSGILSALTGHPVTFPTYTPIVRPRLSRSAPVTPSDVSDAFFASTNWLANASGLVVSNNRTACPAPYAAANESVTCVLEGFSSHILYTGAQELASSIRTDCNAETAMALALHANFTSSAASTTSSATTAKDILNYVFHQSVALHGPRGNSSSPAYGLFAWGMSSPSWVDVFYGDDNARVILSSLVGRAALAAVMTPAEVHAYDKAILTAVIGNVRTTSVHGFRPGRINLDTLLSNGWQYYRTSNYVYANVSTPQPHYQSFLWATFLAVHSATGCASCLDAAVAGINATMAVLLDTPSDFVWTEYLSEELGHMFLPVAWLIRADGDKPLYRQWLGALSGAYLVGREFLGTPGKCTTCPPTSNAAYGTGEGPLIQSDADNVADLLYSLNFAAAGLGEAAVATGDAAVTAMFHDAVELLVRVQATSDALPFVDGAYMRAFDMRLWEAYGSATDWGWGPWSTETGWTQGWVTAALWMRLTGHSLWDVAVGETTMDAALLAQVCAVMMPGDAGCGGGGAT